MGRASGLGNLLERSRRSRHGILGSSLLYSHHGHSWHDLVYAKTLGRCGSIDRECGGCGLPRCPGSLFPSALGPHYGGDVGVVAAITSCPNMSSDAWSADRCVRSGVRLAEDIRSAPVDWQVVEASSVARAYDRRHSAGRQTIYNLLRAREDVLLHGIILHHHPAIDS